MHKKEVRSKYYQVLLTGATGFVGKVLINKLVKRFGSENILCLVFNKNSWIEVEGRKLLDRLKVKYILADLTDYNSLKDIPKYFQLIIHLAAKTDTAKKDHKVNDIGARNLYRHLGVLDKKTYFIHIGTMVEVVGRPDCKKPIDENTGDYPTNEYTRTKLEGEQYLFKKCLIDKFRLTIIRPNTIYGKGVRKNSLFDMVTKMVRERSLITRINWPGRSALIHVEDLTDLIVRFIDRPPVAGNPQKCLAYSENLSIFEISRIIHEKLKLKFKPIYIPNIFWTTLKPFRKFIPLFENLLPYPIYNQLWRFGIIIDDVVCCETQKVFKIFPTFKPKKFEQIAEDVI